MRPCQPSPLISEARCGPLRPPAHVTHVTPHVIPQVRQVGGNGLSDLPHMLVWGGEGMRMDADVRALLAKWTPAIRRGLREGAAP